MHSRSNNIFLLDQIFIQVDVEHNLKNKKYCISLTSTK